MHNRHSRWLAGSRGERPAALSRTSCKKTPSTFVRLPVLPAAQQAFLTAAAPRSAPTAPPAVLHREDERRRGGHLVQQGRQVLHRPPGKQGVTVSGAVR